MGQLPSLPDPVEPGEIPERLARFATEFPGAEHVAWGIALVHHAGGTALCNGATMLVIVADPGYHAIGIYRALGFAGTETQVRLTRQPGLHRG